jgi:flagellar motor protein MotB
MPSLTTFDRFADAPLECGQLGLASGRLTATGLGETRPIATNDGERGRSLNRRVEVKCQ